MVIVFVCYCRKEGNNAQNLELLRGGFGFITEKSENDRMKKRKTQADLKFSAKDKKQHQELLVGTFLTKVAIDIGKL